MDEPPILTGILTISTHDTRHNGRVYRLVCSTCGSWKEGHTVEQLMAAIQTDLEEHEGSGA
jgi:hypothetical protein